MNKMKDVQGILWGDGTVANARWTGVALRDVLLQAGFLDDNVHIAKRGEELDARSLTAIGNFFSSLFNKRNELDDRSLTAIGNFFSNLFNKRDEPLDARSLTAIENFFGNLFDK